MREQDIQRKIKQWLELKGCKVLKYNVNGYGNAGEPDLFCAVPDGSGRSLALYIEVKTPKGKLSEIQKAKLNQLREQGHLALVATDVRAVGVYLTKNGVPLPTLDELPSWSRYKKMVRRCTAPADPKYKDYGARGIKVCDRWLEKGMGYYNFIEDMGLPPRQGMSINRIDNDGDYSPENCEWADARTQANNTRRNHYITVGGVKRTLSDWSRLTGIDGPTIRQRLKLGWSPEEAVSTKPVVGRNQFSI